MIDIHFTLMPAFIVTSREDGFYFEDANQAFLTLRNQGRTELVGQNVLACSPEPLGETLVRHYSTCAETNQPNVYEVEFALGSGCCYWQTTLVPFQAVGSTRSKSLLGFCLDRTEDWLARRASEELNQVLTSMIRSVQGGFWVYDIPSERFEASASLSELVTGTDRAPMTLDDYRSHVHFEDRDLVSDLIPPPEGRSIEFRIATPSGERWFQSRRRLILDGDGMPLRVIAFVTDITDHRSKLISLQKEANTDALTGLQNRRSFDKVWSETFASAHLFSSIGLILIDLDGFKPINDRYGHRVGDQILKKIGRRLGRLARKSDDVARIGGDEFAIVTRDPSRKSLDRLAHRIGQAFDHPFQIDGHSIHVGASLGIALVDPADGSDVDAFERADQQLYAMKSAARKAALRRCG